MENGSKVDFEKDASGDQNYIGYAGGFCADPFFLHLNGLFDLGFKRPITMGDVGHLQDYYCSVESSERLGTEWKKEIDEIEDPSERSLFSALMRFFGKWRALTIIGCVTIATVCQFASPLIMRQLLRHFEGEEVLADGYLYLLVFLTLLCPIIASISKEQVISQTLLSGSSIRTALIALIYDKALKLSPSARLSNAGTINNLFSADTQTLTEIWARLLFVLLSPFQVAVGIWLIYRELGVAIFTSFIVIVGALPILIAAGFGFGHYIRKKMVYSDGRIKTMKEVLNGIRIIKYYAWEDPFVKKIEEYRANEVKNMTMIYYCWLALSTVMDSLPFALPITVFYTYVQWGNALTYSKQFTSLSLFFLILAPIQALSGIAQTVSYAKVSLDRVTRFLQEDEVITYINTDPKNDLSKDSVHSVVFSNANLAWELPEQAAAREEREKRQREIAAETNTNTNTNTTEGKDQEGSVKGSVKNGDYALAETSTDAVSIDASSIELKSSKGPDAPKQLTEEELQAQKDDEDKRNRSLNTLRNLNISLKKGDLVAVVGPVGCGKSSFINAILGDMYCKSGSVGVNGSLVYHAQQPWILNKNIRENILLGAEFDQKRFDETIEAAALKPDIEVLPSGLETEIGERGINLSGGQKARVSLARSLYRDADLVLLDDPLSAVDANVCEHLFRKAILGTLKKRKSTVVLVTHQVHLLSDCDFVIVLNNEGCVRAACPFKELQSNGITSEELTQISIEHEEKDIDEDEDDEGDTSERPSDLNRSSRNRTTSLSRDRSNTALSSRDERDSRDRTSSIGVSSKRRKSVTEKDKDAAMESHDGNKLVEDEDRNTGLIGLDIYKWFIIKGGYENYVYVGLFSVVSKTLSTISLAYLSDWGQANVDAANKGTHLTVEEQTEWLNMYALIGMSSVFVIALRTLATIFHGINAATTLHQSMLDRVMYAPTAFFDVTPVGRILNRFSGDLSIADQGVSALLALCIGLVMDVAVMTITIAYITNGTFIILLIPMTYFCLKIQTIYRSTNVETKRLEAIAKSPVFIEIQQSLSGINSMRAFNEIDSFKRKLNVTVDSYASIAFLAFKNLCWMNVRLDSLCALVSFFVVIIAVFTTNFIEDKYIGLAMTFGMNIGGIMIVLITIFSNLEGMMSGVERIKSYAETVPLEYGNGPPGVINQDKSENDCKGGLLTNKDKDNKENANIEEGSSKASWTVMAKEPPSDWPSEGRIDIKNASMRYRDGPLVLKNITYSIKGTEKVGVAGRTGSGKSSMLAALFRMENLETGSIEIDGIDLASVPLQTLRKKICIIPQDPVMFTASLRYNLDPFSEYTDGQIWEVLERVQLKEAVENMAGQLVSDVAENGENLSVGTRQLICFARALLRKPKVIVLDEATAAVDNNTDNLIQEMIRDKLKDCTVLTIAHRLHTIIESDKVMVLDAGLLAESGSPQQLIEKKGIFGQMWQSYVTSHE